MDRTGADQARGLMDLESQAPATPQTRYRVYSIAKAMTATAAMRLVELERLDLDTPVETYLSDLPDHVHGITARQLMGHRSVSSTQIYTHLTLDHLVRVYERAHPRARGSAP